MSDNLDSNTAPIDYSKAIVRVTITFIDATKQTVDCNIQHFAGNHLTYQRSVVAEGMSGSKWFLLEDVRGNFHAFHQERIWSIFSQLVIAE